jgi:hypothetical protein
MSSKSLIEFGIGILLAFILTALFEEKRKGELLKAVDIPGVNDQRKCF